MSYIFEALKKAEKERNRRTLPDILTVPEENIKKKNYYRLYIFILFLLVLFIILFIGLKSNYKIQIKKEINQTKKISRTNNSSLPEQDIIKNIHFQEGIKKPEKADINNVSENKKDKIVSAHKKQGGLITDISHETDFKQKMHVDSKMEVSMEEQKKEEKTFETEEPEVKPEKDRIYNFNELPPQILKKIPLLKISILIYSDEPSTRMARINGYTLKEGQLFLNGILVEKILNDGVILNYNDFKFKIYNK